jgi:WD40 repeat protein
MFRHVLPALSLYLMALTPLDYLANPVQASEPASDALKATYLTSSEVVDLDVAPDGRSIVVATLGERKVLFIDLGTGKTSQLKVGVKAWSVTISPDGSVLLVGGEFALEPPRTRVEIWDFRKRTLRTRVGMSGEYFRDHVLFTPDGRYAYAQGTMHEGEVYRIDVKTGARTTLFGAGSRLATLGRVTPTYVSVELLAIAPDGNQLVLAVPKAEVVWDLKKDRERLSRASSEVASCAAVSPDEATFVAGRCTHVEVSDFRSGKKIRDLNCRNEQPAGSGVTAIAFSPDSKFLAVAIDGFQGPMSKLPPLGIVTINARIMVWRVGDYSGPVVFPGNGYRIRRMVFVPSTHTLLTGGSDETVRAWNLDNLFWGKAAK